MEGTWPRFEARPGRASHHAGGLLRPSPGAPLPASLPVQFHPHSTLVPSLVGPATDPPSLLSLSHRPTAAPSGPPSVSMHFTVGVLLLLSASRGLLALPTVEVHPGYVEVAREKTSHGTLIYLGSSAASWSTSTTSTTRTPATPSGPTVLVTAEKPTTEPTSDSGASTSSTSTTSGLIARSTAEVPSSYVELGREKTGSGSLIYLGPPEASRMVRRSRLGLEERGACPTESSIICDTNHAASAPLCDQLVMELMSDSTDPIDIAPRQVCFLGASGGSNNYCCVSWSRAVSGLTKGDLANSALSLRQGCTTNGISGRATNTDLHGVCATVCVSNRGTGCA
ncbi:hypothetical protein H2198_001173 [Neophaeococcomyces mojaviensis]|uniref:Uncharacterized protein n=1 Tax=Neophaeococcomyces mojaviensis TaxID=3383035 RepID=A0ACC3AHH8_9EURO|nr:hypothetical protein H2198_001173 [Knufia sp. JES_112]